MQVIINAGKPAETRLLAAFLNDLADLQELEAAQFNLGTTQHAAIQTTATPTPAPEDKPKKSRAKKEEPAAVEPAVETSSASETSSPAADAAGDDKPDVTHDDLRTLFGSLTEAGKRDPAIKIIKSFGVNAIKDIKPEDLVAVHTQLKGL